MVASSTWACVMKTTIMIVAALGLSSAALADQPGRNWLGRPALTQAVAKRGYQITKVEADDGHGKAR